MKAGIFDPYLDTLGGGERYCLTVAEALIRKGYQVDVFWQDRELKEKLIAKFDLDISRVNFVSYSPRGNNLFNRKIKESEYDILFYLSDGSIPTMFGKRNFLHFQVPFKNLKRTIKDRLKLRKIEKIICNSFFTKVVVDKKLGVDLVVIYPPVDVEAIKPGKKEDIIIAVGRFSQLLQNKRQDILVEVFKKMVDQEQLKGWELVLAGGSEVGGSEFLEKIKAITYGYPINIIENPSFRELVQLYGKAKIFWTAAGYGIDEKEEPEKVEHFGITTVEAMAAGCVPIVQGKGGQKEIVNDGKNGFLWTKTEELVGKTLMVVNKNEFFARMSKEALLRSRDFSKKIFSQKIYDLMI